MNINFLNYDEHTPTATEDYLIMIYSKNFLPLVTEATRITHHTATFIDHIYTNALHMNISSTTSLINILLMWDHHWQSSWMIPLLTQFRTLVGLLAIASLCHQSMRLVYLYSSLNLTRAKRL